MRTLKAILWAVLAVTLGAFGALWVPRFGSEPRSSGLGTDLAPEVSRAPSAEAALARLRRRLGSHDVDNGGVGAAERHESIRESIREVGSPGNRNAVPILVEVYDSRSDAALRQEVLQALERIGDETAVRALVTIARSDQDGASQATVRLSRVSHRLAGPTLVEVVEEEGRTGTLAAAAVGALGKTRLRQNVPLLVALARGPRSTQVRLAAARALGLIGDPAGVAALGELLAEATASLRRQAIRSLGTIRSAQSLKHLEDFLRTRPEGLERELAVEAVAALQGESRSPRP